jgi:hypothetical protein
MADKIRIRGAKPAISYASLHNLSEFNIVKQRKGKKVFRLIVQSRENNRKQKKTRYGM